MIKHSFAMRFLILLFLIKSYSFSSEYIDIATCIENRTQQYPLNGYERVTLCSPTRTGSTFVFNILRYLFESNEMKYNPHLIRNQSKRRVFKFHHFLFKKENVIIFTIRNPLHACYSDYRIASNIGKNKLVDEDYIEGLVDKQMTLWYKSEPLFTYNYGYMVLRYEDFVDNIDFLFSQFEAFFSIQIAEEDKLVLQKALDRENVKENIKQFASFNQFDPNSLLHGAHIDQEEITEEERERVNGMILEKLKKHREIIEKWGYSSIFD